MAIFRPVVQKKRTDNAYLVYIRCTHDRKVAYIKTPYYIESSKVKNGEIKNEDIVLECAVTIKQYRKKLIESENDINKLDVNEIVNYLTEKKEGIPFIPYAKEYIRKLSKEGRDNSANNYSIVLRPFANQRSELKNMLF